VNSWILNYGIVQGESNKTLNIFYVAIYLTHKVYSDFVFLCSLHCHLSATLQTTSIIIVNSQDNWAVFRIFIARLRFSFDSPSYVYLN